MQPYHKQPYHHSHISRGIGVVLAALLSGCGATAAAKTATPQSAQLTNTKKHSSAHTGTTSSKVPASDSATTVTLLNGHTQTVLSGPWPTWPARWDQPGKWSNGQTIPTVRGYAFGVPGTPPPHVLSTVIPAGVSAHGMTAQVNQMGQVAAHAMVAQLLGSISAYATDWKTNMTQNTGPYAGQSAQVALVKDANQWFGDAIAKGHEKFYMVKVMPVFAGGLLSSDPTFEVYFETVAANSHSATPSIGASAWVVTVQGNAITGMDAAQVAPTLNSPSVNYTPPVWWQSAEQQIGQPAPQSLY